jgi:hypothetical protein
VKSPFPIHSSRDFPAGTRFFQVRSYVIACDKTGNQTWEWHRGMWLYWSDQHQLDFCLMRGFPEISPSEVDARLGVRTDLLVEEGL